MLTVLGGLAEFERELILSRMSEGRERAKARGVKLGRKPKLTDHQRLETIRRRDQGDETLVEIGLSYNVSGWTIARLSPWIRTGAHCAVPTTPVRYCLSPTISWHRAKATSLPIVVAALPVRMPNSSG